MRAKMVALRYEKPIICTEYGGPGLFEFPENRKYVSLAASWTQSVAKPDQQSALAAVAATNPIEDLYRKMSELAPQTQMFLQGCPPEVDAKYQRIQARGIVERNLFALAAGVQKTLYWYLPATPVTGDARYNLMSVMYGKIGMLELHEKSYTKRYPSADAFERMARTLDGVRHVKRVELAEKPSIFLFAVDRGARGLAYVVWERRDTFSGEDSPAVPFEFPFMGSKANATDALGQAIPVRALDGKLRLAVSVTPILIEPAR